METTRLRIDELTAGDAQFTVLLLNDPDFIANIGDRQIRTQAQAVDYLQDGPISSYLNNGFGMYAVREKSSGSVLGMCGLVKRDGLLDVDIGYAFLPSARGKGYALEAAECIMLFAKDELHLHRLVAIVSPDNSASISLLKTLGLSYESMLKLNPEDESVCLYATQFPQNIEFDTPPKR